MSSDTPSGLYFVGVARQPRNQQPQFEAAASATDSYDDKGNIPFEVCANQHMIATESEWTEGEVFVSLGFQWLLAKRGEWLYVVVARRETSQDTMKGCMHDLLQEWSPSVHKLNGIDRCATILLRWSSLSGSDTTITPGASNLNGSDTTTGGDSNLNGAAKKKNRPTLASLRASRNKALEAVRQSTLRLKKQPEDLKSAPAKEEDQGEDVFSTANSKRDEVPTIPFCGAGMDSPMLDAVLAFFSGSDRVAAF